MKVPSLQRASMTVALPEVENKLTCMDVRPSPPSSSPRAKPTCFVVGAGTMAVISVPAWELFLFLGLDENIMAEL